MDRILAGMWQALKEQMVEDFSIFGLFALVILVLCIILVLLLRRRTTPQVGLSKIRSADTLLPLDPEPRLEANAPAEPDKEEAKAIRKFIERKFDRAGIPGEGVYATAVMVGATNAAIYDVYADFADKKSSEVRSIRYKKFKKLAEHLLTGEDRSGLILNNAPEKVHLIGVAAVVLKTLFKRFGVDNIVVSERGVKEGYLELVLRGEETGLYYDFSKGGVDGTERIVPPLMRTQKILPDAKAEPTRSSRGGKHSEKRAKDKTEVGRTGTEKAPAARRRGRPAKTALPAAAPSKKESKTKQTEEK